MTTLTVNDYLKYANLQMAAEALYTLDATKLGENLIPGKTSNGAIDPNVLTDGNLHASKFTATQAAEFADQWEVVEHKSNTTTGFSGTLFQAIKDDPVTGVKKGELVLSFRSTEFVDDAARDNQATNKLEVAENGWAFGQIADMEVWYASLHKRQLIPAGAHFSVTGYSLGGHLATAFNLLRDEDGTRHLVDNVVTFNGAGVGEIEEGRLTDVIGYFQTLRTTPSAIDAAIGDPALLKLVRDIRTNLETGRWNVGQAKNAINELGAQSEHGGLTSEQLMVWNALDRVEKVTSEATDAPKLASGSSDPNVPPNPAKIPVSQIEQTRFDYQLAVMLASQRASAIGLLDNAVQTFTERKFAESLFDNQHDVMGTTDPSAVANSQLHYGADVKVMIEGQPLMRGSMLSEVLVRSLSYWDIRLLVNHYSLNSFGDTHSLVLIVDSLTVQNTLLQLLPKEQRASTNTVKTLKNIFQAASYLEVESGVLYLGNNQGKAEGNVLENIVSALGNLLLGPEQYRALAGNPNGGTWAKIDDTSNGTIVYAGRDEFYKAIQSITDSAAYGDLRGKLILSASSAALKDDARDDFTAFAAIYSLSPFRVESSDRDALETVLGTAWGRTYTDWKADQSLTPEELAAGKGVFGETWLGDRSAFLGHWVTAGELNVDTLTGVATPGLAGTAQRVYKDLASAQAITVMSDTPQSGEPIPDKESQYIIFGGKGVDVIEGGKLDDHLYGGFGTDYLAGKGGADYLEGGAGLDLYNYNARTIAGAFGSADINDGNDTVRDTDGRGVLRYTYTDGDGKAHSTVIAEASFKVPDTDNQWQSADGKFTYTKDGSDLVVTINGDASGSLTLKNFKDGDYNVHLREARAVPQTAGDPIVGDLQPQDIDPDADGVQTGTDALGNVKVTSEAAPGRADTLYGSAEGDRIDGMGGDDIIDAKAGNDWISGGAGRDRIDAGAGNDLVEGGADSDVIDGGAGDDELYADSKISLNEAIVQGNLDNGTGQKGDFLSGGIGADWLIGGRGNDVLLGGEGNDLIVGGAGDDIIDGDSPQTAVMVDWTVTRGQDIQNGRVVDFFWELSGGASGNDPYFDIDQGGADVIYGGSGNDWIYGRGGDDFIDGSDGEDNIAGGAGSDILIGGKGNDHLFGDRGDDTSAHVAGADYLDGGDGEDALWGNGGDDILIGGKGKDYLNGGVGRDIYIFNKGDGVDIIDDKQSMETKEASILILGEGINKKDVRFRRFDTDSLVIDLGPSDPTNPGSTHDAIHVLGFNHEDPKATPLIGEIRFSDGQVMGYADILAQGFDISPVTDDAGNHDINVQLTGTGVSDRIRGTVGSDVLIGLRGDDVLRGSAGDDKYIFNLGDGQDTIIDSEGTDTIEFGAGISPDAIRLAAIDGTLVVRYSEHDSITVNGVVRQYRFDDGTVISYEDMMARLSDAINVVGTAVDETIIGGAGNDALWGGAGSDILKGGAGNDYLYGEDGNDTLTGGAGNDTLFGQNGNDILRGGDGADQLVGGIGNDALSGDAGADRLWGQAGDDVLNGGDGNDELYGGDGTDRLTGGRGDDLLVAGGTGAKTYVFDLGDGNDTILSTAGSRHVQFGEGIASSDIKLFLSPANAPAPYVRVQYSAQDSVMIQLANGGPLDYRFAGGTVMTHASLVGLATQANRAQYAVFGTANADRLFAGSNPALLEGSAGNDQLHGSNFDDILHGGSGDDTLNGNNGNDMLEGGSGNDTLNGSGGNDTLRGGVGDDRLDGSIGSDTYLYAHGDGSDIIAEDNSSGTDINVLRFADLTAADITFSHEANGSLKIHIDGSSDVIEVRGWYNDAAKRLQQIVYADGTVFDTAALDDLEQVRIVGQGNGDHLAGTPFNDVIVGTYGNDAIDGGGGNDRIIGGAGSDTYLMYRGMGLDTIHESVGGTNFLKLAAGQTFDQLATTRKGNDLHVHFIGGSDGVLLKDYFAGNDAWMVIGDDGQGKTISDVIADAGNRSVAETVEQVRDQWVSQSQLKWIQSWIDDTNYSNSTNQSWTETYTQPNPYALNFTRISNKGDVSHTSFSYSHATRYSDDAYIERFTEDLSSTSYITTSATINLPPARYSVDGSNESGYTVTDYARLDSAGNPVRFTMLPGGGMPMGDFDPAIFENSSTVGAINQYAVSRTERVTSYTDTVEHLIAGPSNNFINTWDTGTVDAGDGDDFIYAATGNEEWFHFLYGGAGNDIILDGFGNDMLIGGEGNDYLMGNQGNDTYYLMANETGTKIIDEAANVWDFSSLENGWVEYNNGSRYSTDTVEFGAGIDLAHLHVRRGEYASPYDAGYNNGWDADNRLYQTLDFSWGESSVARVLLIDPDADYYWEAPENDGYGIEFFKFADGTALTMQQMQELIDARIQGGIDLWLGDGETIIGSPDGIETMRFGHGILPEDVVVSREGDDLVLTVQGRADAWRFQDWYVNPPTISAQFVDGTVWAALGAAEDDAVIAGTDEDDYLNAPGDSNYTFMGAAGNDTLVGGLGDDIYVFNLGDGVDQIVDVGGSNIIQFGPGITPDMITLDLGSLLLRIGENGDQIHIEGFDPDNALGTGVIQTFRFDDGTVLTYEQLLSRGFDIHGGDGDDTLRGTNLADRFHGGLGNDLLLGGAGNDHYLYSSGDGADHIVDIEGDDTLHIGGGLTASDLQAERQGDDLVVRITGSADAVTLAGWFNHAEGVNRIVFDDGSQLDRQGMALLVNHPPVAVADQVAMHEDGGMLDIPVTHLLANDTDLNPQDDLTVISVGESEAGASVTLLDGRIAYEVGDGFQHLAEGEVLRDRFAYTISDAQGEMATSFVEVDIVGANDIPVVTPDAAEIGEDAALPITGNVLANDSDADAGTVLQVVSPGTFEGQYGHLALAQDGSYIYSRNKAGAAIQSLGRGQVVTDSFAYGVTDGIAEVVSALEVTIAGANDAPEVAAPLADRNVKFNKRFTWQMPPDSFTDVDAGDALTYHATLADGSSLPSWLSFDAQTQTFSGFAPKKVSHIDILVTATDQVAADGSSEGSLAASDVFRLSVVHKNKGVGKGVGFIPPGHAKGGHDKHADEPVKNGKGKDKHEKEGGDAEDENAKNGKKIQQTIAAYLNGSQLAQYAPAAASSIGNTASAEAFVKWLAVGLAVSEALANQKTLSWLDDDFGADTLGLSRATLGGLGSSTAFGDDRLSLVAGTGKELKTFKGLGKGIATIA